MCGLLAGGRAICYNNFFGKEGAAVKIGRESVWTPGDYRLLETERRLGRGQMCKISPRESPNTCLSLRATTGKLMLATITSSCRSVRQPCRFVGQHTGAHTLLLSSLSLRATTPRFSVQPTPRYSWRFFLACFAKGGRLLPCATTLSLRVTMRSSMDEVPLPIRLEVR